jgi:hypothetical protein
VFREPEPDGAGAGEMASDAGAGLGGEMLSWARCALRGRPAFRLGGVPGDLSAVGFGAGASAGEGFFGSASGTATGVFRDDAAIGRAVGCSTGLSFS